MEFSSGDIYTGGVYLKNNPQWHDEFAAWKAGHIKYILQRNNIHPVSVAEVGCGAGGVLQSLQQAEKGIEKLVGYDISPDAIKLAQVKENENLHFFNEDFLKLDSPNFDLLLCIDVLEHVDDKYGFLNELRQKATYSIFHIPLDVSARTILKPHTMLMQRKSVGHIHYFTKETACWALEDTGYKVLDFFYTKPAGDWQPATSIKQSCKKFLRNFSFQISPSFSSRLWGDYSIMILTRSV